MDFVLTRLNRDDVAQELDEGGARMTGTVWPVISPVVVFSAAYSDNVPWPVVLEAVPFGAHGFSACEPDVLTRIVRRQST
jgi:hypothetical protein